MQTFQTTFITMCHFLGTFPPPTSFPLCGWHIQQRSKDLLLHPSVTVSSFPRLPALASEGGLPSSLRIHPFRSACQPTPWSLACLSILGIACARRPGRASSENQAASCRGHMFSVSYPKLHQVGAGVSFSGLQQAPSLTLLATPPRTHTSSST